MGFLGRLFGSKPEDDGRQQRQLEQAVIVHLDGTSLPAEVYEKCDLATIEDRLIEVIEREGLGEFDGNEVGVGECAGEASLFMYGPDAEQLFAGIEQTLRSYPLCQGARVVVRRGGPGAQEREVRL
jgi:hypothetical protein